METAKHAKKLPGNSLPADEGSASIAQVREVCPRVTGYTYSINKRTEFAGAPAIGGGAMMRRQVLFPGSFFAGERDTTTAVDLLSKSIAKKERMEYNIIRKTLRF